MAGRVNGWALFVHGRIDQGGVGSLASVTQHSFKPGENSAPIIIRHHLMGKIQRWLNATSLPSCVVGGFFF